MNDELRSQLWEFAYGLLEADAAEEIRARITSDRDVARAYARMKLQTELVAQAARANQEAGQWPVMPGADSLASVRTGSARYWARPVLAGGALALSLLLLILAGVAYETQDSPVRTQALAQAWDSFANSYPRVLVTGPTKLGRGETAKFQVLVSRLDNGELQRPVHATLADHDGNVVWSNETKTGPGGTAWLDVATDLPQDSYRLNIAVDAPASSRETLSTHQAPVFGTWLAVETPHPAEIAAFDCVSVAGTKDRLYRYAPLHGSYSQDARSFGALAQRAKEQTDEAEVIRLHTANADRPVDRESPQQLVETLDDEAQQVTVAKRGDEDSLSGLQAGDVPFQTPAEKSGDSAKLAEGLPPAEMSEFTRMHGETELAGNNPVGGSAAGGGGGLGAFGAGRAGPLSRLENAPQGAPSPRSSSLSAATSAGDLDSAAAGGSSLAGVKKLLVEAIWDNGRVVSTRFVTAPQDANAVTLESRALGLQQTQEYARSTADGIQATLYDYSVAPPQPWAEAAFQGRPATQPLALTCDFDKQVYHGGDLATCDLRCADATGQPLPAILSVHVDAIALDTIASEEHEAETPATVQFDDHSFVTYVNGPQTTRDLPLVYDNAAQQNQQLRRAVDAWLATRKVYRQEVAVVLLFGSGLGYSLLLILALLKWLPGVRVWLPAAALLGCSSVLGVLWMAHVDEQTPVVQVSSMTNFGVCTEPPRSEALAPASGPMAGAETAVRFADESLHTQYFAFNDPSWAIRGLAKDSPGPDLSYALPPISAWYKPEATTYEEKMEAQATALDSRETFSQSGNDSALPALITDSPSPAGTVYWHPLIKTDAAGHAKVEFEMPSGPLAYRICVQAHSGLHFGTQQRTVPSIVRIWQVSEAVDRGMLLDGVPPEELNRP